MKFNYLLIFLFLSSYSICAQIEEQELDSVSEKMIIISGDSLLQNSIALEEAYVFGKLKFSSYDDKLRYYILRRKTEKVYPYAKLAAERLVELNDSPDVIEEDYLIEDILQRAFSNGKLERQATVLDYDYDKLYNKWKKTTKIPKN